LRGAINPEAYQDPTDDAELERIEHLAAEYQIEARSREGELRRNLEQTIQRLEATDTAGQLREALRDALAAINGEAWLLFNDEEQARLIQTYVNADARLNEIEHKEGEDAPAMGIDPMPVVPADLPQPAEAAQDDLIRQLQEATKVAANDGDIIDNVEGFPPAQVIDAFNTNGQRQRMLRIATPTALNDEIAANEDAALLCPVWGTISRATAFTFRLFRVTYTWYLLFSIHNETLFQK
jgi:hypothetical protein